MFEAKEIFTKNNDWILFIFLFILFLLAIVRLSFKDRLLHTNTLFIQKKYLKQYFNKEKNIVLNLFQTSLFIIQVLSLSLLFYFAIDNFKLNPIYIGFNGYLYILLGITLYFLFRHLIGMFLAEVFSLKKFHKRVLYDKMSYFNNLSLWILPFIITYAYIDIFKGGFFTFILVLFSILLVFRYVLFILNNKTLLYNNLFYFILYLCAFELAPLFVLFRWIF
jgi:hypothetical protein